MTEKYKIGTPFIQDGIKWYQVYERNAHAVEYNKKLKEDKYEPRKPFCGGGVYTSIPLIEWHTVEYFKTLEECENYIKSKTQE